jgi:hypothetical protein
MRDGLGIDSPRMGPGCPTKVLGKRNVPVELDYSITNNFSNLKTGNLPVICFGEKSNKCKVGVFLV